MSSPTFRIKSAELLVSGTNPEHMEVSTTLLSLPRTDGGIFGLVSITSRKSDDKKRLFHIIKSHLEVMRTDISAEEINVPRRFEAMLVTLNADLARFSESNNIPLKNVNIIIGVMTNTQIYFSGTGTNHALFLHRTAERRYVIYELDAQLARQENNWEKPLATVLDGELHPGDVFYIATKIPQNALNLGDLQDILVTLPPNGALERIQQFVPVTAHFGGICFHVNDDVVSGPPKKANPMASLSSFEDTKTRTADLLGDQVPDLSQKISQALGATKNALSSYSDSALWRGVKRGARGILSFIERRLSRHTQDHGSVARHARGSSGRVNGITIKLVALRHAGVTAAKGASRTTKIVAGTLGILVIIIGISISMNRAQQRVASATVAYESIVTKIEEKRTAAEAAIIYGNTQDAQTLLTDAQTLIATMPRDTNARETKAADLSRAISELLGKTRGLETVTPVTIAQLPDQFAFPLISLTSAGTAMFGVTSDGASWRVNEVSKALERSDIGTSPAQNILFSTREGNNILSVDMDKRLWRTTTSTPSITSLTSGIDALTSVEDVTSYNNNIYVLTAATGQIVKMRPQGLGFEAGTPWITEKTTDLSYAKALTIDGNIWVVTATDIVKFASGKETPWNHATIDPVLVKPVDIWTDIDSKYIYILDANDGRVIVMDKDHGGIVAQYITNTTSVVGFTVRESENRILLSTPTTVYSFTASHLLK